MSYIGDFRLGDTVVLKFTTTAAATGAPTTLSGGVVACYPNSSTTEITAGITTTLDFDSRTGMHNVSIVASSGNGYATNTNYSVVITTGTVGGTSAVGYVVGEFSIEARSAVMPTTALRTLDIAATGEAGVDFDNILLTNSAPKAGIGASGTLSGTHSTTSATLGTNAPGANTIVVGQTLYFPAFQLSVPVLTYNNATGVATFAAVTPTLVNGNVWFLYPSAAGSGSAPTASQNAAAVWDELRASHVTAGTFGQGAASVQGNVTGSVASVTGAVGSVTGAVGSVTGAVGSVTGAVASVTGNVGGNVVGSVGSVAGSVTGSVGSVTGNVGGNVVGSTGSVIALVTANVTQINSVAVVGNGTAGNLWRA